MKTEAEKEQSRLIKEVVKTASTEQECISALLSKNMIKSFAEGRRIWSSLKSDKLILG